MFRSGKPKQDPNLAVAESLAQLLGSCPRCQSGFTGHEYALLATWVVPKQKDETLSKYFEAVKQHDWPKLREFQSWLGGSDDIEAYAIRCSETVNIVVRKTHFELFHADQLLYSEPLPPQESNRLLDTFAEVHWHPF